MTPGANFGNLKPSSYLALDFRKSFECVALLLFKLLAKNLEPGGNPPPKSLKSQNAGCTFPAKISSSFCFKFRKEVPSPEFIVIRTHWLFLFGFINGVNERNNSNFLVSTRKILSCPLGHSLQQSHYQACVKYLDQLDI